MRAIAGLLSVLAVQVSAHMAIIKPCPRYNAHGVDCPPLPEGEKFDYNEKDPIGNSGNIMQPICKYTKPWPSPAASWTAGQSISVEFENYGSSHGGGHCEFSLSYDGGKTFIVIHQVLRHCFYDSSNSRVGSYTFNLPDDAPASKNAIFAWSWVNAIGNREFYMNCADVVIDGESTSFSGRMMVIANYGSDYPVIDEFRGNYDTGIEFYTNSSIATVTV